MEPIVRLILFSSSLVSLEICHSICNHKKKITVMKKIELAEATSWRIPDFDDATRVAHEETKNHRNIDKKLPY